MQVAGKRIYVGLSGGVDSAVTAALLQEQGANVTGVFIKGWYPPGMPCSWAEDRRDAMRVAAHLRIPFETLDASREYKKSVIDYLLHEYREGRTPNPDIMCNRDVKFGAFYDFAMRKKADYIATGHYARTGEHLLMRGIDEGKDQSYFLWAISPEALSHTLFPLGGMHKEEVRRLAAKYELPNAVKKDSQGICFLGSISVEDFLRDEIGTSTGKGIDDAGKEVGTHDGAVLYTLGERIALNNAPPGPWYVVAKDLTTNVLTVSRGKKLTGSTNTILLTSTNWFSGNQPEGTCEAQYRYHGPRITGTLSGNTFTPAQPVPEALAQGQSLVIYNDSVCMGGGIIS